MMRDDPIKALVDAFIEHGVDFVIAYAQNGVVKVEHSDSAAALGIANVAEKVVSRDIMPHTKVNEG
jgi:predicted oxidoreductase